MSQVAVVGAGLSGLCCARRLQQHAGYDVRVFEKARGLGGRTSTRRTDAGPCFDHGAQYFTAREARFRAQVDAWVESGVVAPWEGRIGVREDGRLRPKSEGPRRWVGTPGMNAMAKHLAQGLDVQLQVQIQALERRQGRWRLHTVAGQELDEGGQGFEAVVLSLPPSQAAALLEGHDHAAAVTHRVEMRPCWSVMLSFVRPLEVAYDGIFINEGPLSWVARNSSKPGRNETETWILHGSPDWSRAHLALAPPEAQAELVRAFFEVIEHPPVQPSFHTAHRWRFSIPEQALELGCWWDHEQGLGMAGDWLNGARVEGAFLSGLELAHAIAES
ncbi:MAG: FAD-dependent oxidoreductase [Myxococcota bacterium]